MKLRLLHGTETGTAEMLCEDLEAALKDEFECENESLEDLDPAALDADSFHVLFVSTFGSGDVPFSAQPFYEKLTKESPDLGHVKFAIFGLGDKMYDRTFAQGSEKVMNKMIECKAQMIGKRGTFDSSSSDMPDDVALPWLRETLKQVGA